MKEQLSLSTYRLGNQEIEGWGEAELSEVTKIVSDKESEYKWPDTKAHIHYYTTLPHKRWKIPFPF